MQLKPKLVLSTASAEAVSGARAQRGRRAGRGAGQRDLRPLLQRADLQVDPPLLPTHVRGAQAQALPVPLLLPEVRIRHVVLIAKRRIAMTKV